MFKKSFEFPKEFHCEERSGTLHCGKEEVEGYLQETHSDPLRDKSLGHCLKEVKVDPLEALMYVGEPTWKEVKEVV